MSWYTYSMGGLYFVTSSITVLEAATWANACLYRIVI